MISFHVSVDDTEVSSFLRHLFEDQIPFATAQAINETAKAFQERQRAHQRDVFEVRRPSFVDRAVKIKPFASKRSLRAVVSIDPPGGPDRAHVLAKFEDQRVKRPTRGKRIAVPVNVRRTPTGVVSRTLWPRNLNFRPHGSSSRVYRGDRRTFAVFGSGGTGSIFQRQGRGENSRLETLYTLQPEVRFEPVLDFEENARETIEEQFSQKFGEAFSRSIITAR